MKNLFGILKIIVIILCIISVLTVVLINIDLADHSRYSFAASASGFEFYLARYGTYKDYIFNNSVSIAALGGIKGLQESIQANCDKLKQDRFLEWKNALELRIKEIVEKDQYMDREFTKRRYQIFSILYRDNFEIASYEQLKEIFEVFKDVIPFLEEQNKRHISLGGIYPDGEYSYAFDSFKFVLYAMNRQVLHKCRA